MQGQDHHRDLRRYRRHGRRRNGLVVSGRGRGREQPRQPPSAGRDDRRYRYPDDEVAYILQEHEAFPEAQAFRLVPGFVGQGKVGGEDSRSRQQHTV